MAKVQVIFADADELILLLKGKAGREAHNFSAANVQSIAFGFAKTGILDKLLKRQPRQITVRVKGLGTVEFSEADHKAYFETYLADLRAFCKRNGVTFYDYKQD